MYVKHHLEVAAFVMSSNLKIQAFWTKTWSVSVSSSDVMAQKKVEGKQLANSAQHDFHITKGAVWFKLLGLSTTNQDS